jgi:hypothetical protein
MTQELDEQLFNDFDFFHPDRHPRHGLMCFGFECGDGWYNLIRKLCEDLKKMIPKQKDYQEQSDFEVVQVKEKFGGLRFYTNWATEEMFERIEKAERDSYKICEVCGNSGSLRKGAWLRTLCDYHAKAAGYNKESNEE